MQENFSNSVKKALVDKQSTVTALAKRIGRSRTAVSLAINHPTMFPAIKKKIARALSL